MVLLCRSGYIGKAKQRCFWRSDISCAKTICSGIALSQGCAAGLLLRSALFQGSRLFFSQVRAKAWLGSLPFPFSSNSWEGRLWLSRCCVDTTALEEVQSPAAECDVSLQLRTPKQSPRALGRKTGARRTDSQQ